MAPWNRRALAGLRRLRPAYIPLGVQESAPLVPMPSDSVSIREANLASAVVHGALYGVFFVFSITTLVLLAYRQGGRPFSTSGTPRSLRGLWRNPLFLGSIVLFLTVTTVSPSFWSTGWLA